MTTEEKAKAYDEAIERANKIDALNKEYLTLKEAKEYIFPQLAESEDERIRKAIIKALLTDEGIDALDDADVEYEEATAWLEKQKEQKPLPGFENADEGIPGKDFIPVEWVDTCDRYGKWKIVRCDEQKPAEWSEEDDALLKDIVSFFKDGTVKLQHDLNLYAGFLEKKFKSLRPQPHWKPSVDEESKK